VYGGGERQRRSAAEVWRYADVAELMQRIEMQ